MYREGKIYCDEKQRRFRAYIRMGDKVDRTASYVVATREAAWDRVLEYFDD